MILKIYLDETTDADLIAALEAMPKGERSARSKTLLALALAGTGGVLARIEALERRVAALEHHPTLPETTASPTSQSDARKAALSLFQQFGALDE